jgi:hypothetical protein
LCQYLISSFTFSKAQSISYFSSEVWIDSVEKFVGLEERLIFESLLAGSLLHDVVEAVTVDKRLKYEAFLKTNKLFDGIDPYFATKIADGLSFRECKTGD